MSYGDDHTHQGELPDGGEFGAGCDGVTAPPGCQSGREGGREERSREGGRKGGREGRTRRGREEGREGDFLELIRTCTVDVNAYQYYFSSTIMSLEYHG